MMLKLTAVLSALSSVGIVSATGTQLPFELQLAGSALVALGSLRVHQWRQDRRKVKAEAERTDAETHRTEAETESISVTTANEMVSAVRREINEIRGKLDNERERRAKVETLLDERDGQHKNELRTMEARHLDELRERDDLAQEMRHKLVMQGNEIKTLRALIAGRVRSGRDDDPVDAGDLGTLDEA